MFFSIFTPTLPELEVYWFVCDFILFMMRAKRTTCARQNSLDWMPCIDHPTCTHIGYDFLESKLTCGCFGEVFAAWSGRRWRSPSWRAPSSCRSATCHVWYSLPNFSSATQSTITNFALPSVRNSKTCEGISIERYGGSVVPIMTSLRTDDDSQTLVTIWWLLVFVHPFCEKATSSTKPEVRVHNVNRGAPRHGHYKVKNAVPHEERDMWICGIEICAWTDVQPYMQTYRHADRNTLHFFRGRSNNVLFSPRSKVAERAIQGAPIKNTPLGKIHYLHNCNRFCHYICSFYRKDSGHILNKFLHNIFYLKITYIWTKKCIFLSEQVIKLRFWCKITENKPKW